MKTILMTTLLSSSFVLLAACQSVDREAAAPTPQRSSATTFAALGMSGGENVRQDYIAELDSDGDGRVTRDDVARFRAERLRVADTNGDGAISEDEYVDEYAVRLERRIENERTSQVEQTRTRFDALDKNSDGAISPDEYKASGDRAFSRFDPDGSGTIRATEGDEQQVRQRSVLAMPTTHSLAGFMELYDEDADGVVTRETFEEQRRRAFAASDADGNGVLSGDEYHREFEDRVDRQADSVRERQLKQARVRFGVLDADKDGSVSLAEYTATGMRGFDNWDTDGDGVVSADEPLPERRSRQQATEGDSRRDSASAQRP
jgi:Ca2+-binding EF-hand superfamily protein